MRPTVEEMFPPRPPTTGAGLLNHRALASRGWSKGMVKTFLLACDRSVPNPHHPNGLPMQLYALERVVAAEAHPDFSVRKARAARRSAALRPSVERRRELLLEKASAVDLSVPVLDPRDLVRLACRSNNAYWESKDRWDRRVTPNDSRESLDRACVNYLFYECAAYRASVETVLGEVGAADARLVVARRVLEGIAEAYPFLSAECDRQYFRRVEETEMLDTRIVLGT